MTTRSDCNRPATWRLLVLSATLCVLLHVASGCAFSTRVQTPRSSWEQILATTAIDRALKQLEWPEVDGKSVFVEVGPPGDVLDDLYLRRRIEVSLADRGAQVVRSAEAAEYVLSCLVGAIGLDISGRFMGLMGSQGGFIPFTIPELALYKNTLRRGVAKTEIYLVDLETKKIIHHSGPVEGAAYRQSKTYFFVFETRDSDTHRLE
ncbi:MAG: hypothetical protein ACC649_02275 [Myxococcota bacterium]